MNADGLCRTLGAALGWADAEVDGLDDERLSLDAQWERAIEALDALLARLQAAEDELECAMAASISDAPQPREAAWPARG